MTLPDRFLHRPISVTVEKVLPLEAVRSMPAVSTSIMINLKLDQRTARALAMKLLEQILADDEKRVDLVSLSLEGTMR